MTQPFYNGSSFQYVDNFQPLDNTYNDYPAPGGQTWIDASEDLSSCQPPFYQEIPLPVDQTYLQPVTTQSYIPQQAVQCVPIATYAPTYNFPVVFGSSQVLSYYPQYPTQYTQPVDRAQQIQSNHAVTPSPKRPIVAAKAVEWENNNTSTFMVEDEKTAKKRKTQSIAPAKNVKKEKTEDDTAHEKAGTRSLEDCMGLFDTTLTATKEKRRRKAFSAQEKKAVKSVRNIGACISCKFRKKTCSAGRPCPYCMRIAGSTALGAQLCHRESPFVDRSVTHYYPSSSRKRITDFKLLATDLKGSQRTISIDGTGRVTLPLHIKIRQCETASLGVYDAASVLRTAEQEIKLENPDSLSKLVNILEPGSLSQADVEQWAFEYTSKFARTKNPHATGFIFGVEYASRGLPHSELVTKMTRLVSLNFVLRAGVQVLPSKDGSTSPFRTIQAQIDTLLFQAFCTTEKSLYKDLQRLIFRSAGSLARDAVVPVCLCVWQLARLQCMLASQLSNLATYDLKRSRRNTPAPDSSPNPPSLTSNSTRTSISDPVSTFRKSTISPVPDPNTEHRTRSNEAEHLIHGLNLLLCTFEALFRSSCPLLLNWNDQFSCDLLKNDEHLVALAGKMGRTLRGYRARGHSRKFKLGFGYKKEMADRIRGLLRER